MDSWLKENGVPILIGIALATLILSLNIGLRGDMGRIEAGLLRQLGQMENRFKDDMAVLKGDVAVLKGDVAVLKGEVSVLKVGVDNLETRSSRVSDDDIPEVRERLAAIEALTKDIHSFSAGRLPPDFTDAVALKVAEMIASGSAPFDAWNADQDVGDTPDEAVD